MLSGRRLLMEEHEKASLRRWRQWEEKGWGALGEQECR